MSAVEEPWRAIGALEESISEVRRRRRLCARGCRGRANKRSKSEVMYGREIWLAAPRSSIKPNIIMAGGVHRRAKQKRALCQS